MLCPKCHRPLAEEDDGLYICCADAPLQWQCGECGKVSEGFAFPYGRCPQCSGPLALCSEDKSIAADEVQALNAVRMAFEIELGGRAFYRSAAADCRDAQLRALFSRFAAMEDEHMETLSRRYHVAAPDSLNASGVERAAIFGGVDHHPGDADSLFRIAIALERKAAEFFATRSAKVASGSPEQRLYLELGAEERDHMALLATEYARWRAQKPGLFSGDPP